MTLHVAQWCDLVVPQTYAHVFRAQKAVHAEAFVVLMASCLFDHAMVVERSSLMMLAVFCFSQILISMLQSHLEAPKSVGLILLSKMTRVLFYPHAHLIRLREF
jgi:hypothetical protein